MNLYVLFHQGAASVNNICGYGRMHAGATPDMNYVPYMKKQVRKLCVSYLTI